MQNDEDKSPGIQGEIVYPCVIHLLIFLLWISLHLMFQMGCLQNKCKQLFRELLPRKQAESSSIKRFSCVKHSHILEQIRF